MGRQPRPIADGLVYHALNRGNNRSRVFFHDADFQQFLYALAQTKERYPFRLYAYCLMEKWCQFFFFSCLRFRKGVSWRPVWSKRHHDWDWSWCRVAVAVLVKPSKNELTPFFVKPSKNELTPFFSGRLCRVSSLDVNFIVRACLVS